MADYGFSINVSGNSIAQMKQIEAELQKLGVQAKTTTGDVQNSFSELGQSAMNLGKIFLEVFAVREIINFGRELMNTAAEFEAFENVIRYSSNGIVDAGKNLDYVRESVDRLHLPMRQAYEAFSEMQAGFYGTGIEGDKLRKVFEGVSEAGTVLHLSPDAFSRTTYAMKEMGELGTVQMRQMRMLAMALPGAMNLAAQSMHMTTEQFHEAMKGGKINSSEFLPKFAETLQQRFSSGLPNAGNSLMSQINDAKNSILKLYQDMGESLKPLWLDILHTIGTAMKEFKEVWDSLTGNASFVNALKTIFDWLVKLLPIWLAYRGVLMAWGALTSIIAIKNGVLSLSMGELTVMTDGATTAFEGLDAVIASTGWGALAIGIGLIAEQFMSLNQEASDFADKVTHMSKQSALYQTNAESYQNISNRFGALNGTQNNDYRSQLLTDALAQQAKVKKDIEETVKPDLQAAQKEYVKLRDIWKANPNDKFGSTYEEQARHRDALAEKIGTLSNNLKQMTLQQKNLGEYAKALQSKGIKPLKASAFGTGTQDASIKVSALSGAKGGLGEAKVINIHIDTVQRIDKVSTDKDWKNSSESAIQYLIRTLNNMAYSQSQTM